MNLDRLHTESIRHCQHQAIGNHGHEGLARSQGNPAGELTLGINDVPNLVPPVRSPAHPKEVVRSAQEFEHRWVVSGKVNGTPCYLSQRIEHAPLPEDLLRDGVLKPQFPVLRRDLETVTKGQRNDRPLFAVETQNPDL